MDRPRDKMVYIGPSGSSIAPSQFGEVGVRSAICAGDLRRLVNEGFSGQVLIVDGLFGQKQCLTIGEIRAAIDAGIQIFGAVSLGAIRAAECLPLGMFGLGRIFDCIMSGQIVRDSDLSVSVDQQGNATTIPLVNIKYLLQILSLSEIETKLLIEVSENIHFSERGMTRLKNLVGDCDLRPESRRSIQQMVSDEMYSKWGLKAIDAHQVIREFRSLTPRPRVAPGYVELAVPKSPDELLAREFGASFR